MTLACGRTGQRFRLRHPQGMVARRHDYIRMRQSSWVGMLTNWWKPKDSSVSTILQMLASASRSNLIFIFPVIVTVTEYVASCSNNWEISSKNVVVIGCGAGRYTYSVSNGRPAFSSTQNADFFSLFMIIFSDYGKNDVIFH